MRPIIKGMAADGVFVREVESRGLAYHSPALDSAVPGLIAGALPTGAKVGLHNVGYFVGKGRERELNPHRVVPLKERRTAPVNRHWRW